MNLIAGVLSALLLLCGVASAAGEAPSLNLALGQKPIQAIVDKVVPPLVQSLNGLTFPTISGSSHVGGIVGTVDYTVSDLKLASISTDAPVVSTSSGLGITLANTAIVVDAHFEVKETDFPHVSTHGDIQADLSETTIAIAIEIDAAATTGAPTFKVTDCTVSVGHIKLHFSDNFWSWLENLLSDLFEKTIRDQLANAIQTDLANKLTQSGNQALQNLPLTDKFGDWAEFQWRLAQNSVTTASDFTLSLAADVTTQSVPVYPPGMHHTLPTGGSDMINIYLDQYLLNSAFWAAQQSDVIDAKVTNGQLFPISSPIGKLINSTVVGIINSNPMLKKLLPYETSLITFEFETENAPQIEFAQTTDAHFSAPFQISLGAVDNALKVITIEAPVTASVALNLQQGETAWTLVPSFETLTFQVTNITSVVGPIKEPQDFDKIVDIVLNEIAVPYLNQLLAKGFALPALPAGVSLSNPVLTFNTGFVEIAADVDVSSSLIQKDLVDSSGACGDADQKIMCQSVSGGVCQLTSSFKKDSKECGKKLLQGESASTDCYVGLGLSQSCAAAQTSFGVCLSKSACAFACGVLNDCAQCDSCMAGSNFKSTCTDPYQTNMGFSVEGGSC